MSTVTSDSRVAALFVATDGPYFCLEGVDPWDIRRDARRYRLRAAGQKPRKRLSRRQCIETPLPFRDLLLSIARGRSESLLEAA